MMMISNIPKLDSGEAPKAAKSTASTCAESVLFPQASLQTRDVQGVAALLEDFIQNKTVVFIHKGSAFFESFNEVSSELGIQVVFLESSFLSKKRISIGNVWTRDYFYKGLDETGKPITYVVPNFGDLKNSFEATQWSLFSWKTLETQGVVPIYKKYDKDLCDEEHLHSRVDFQIPHSFKQDEDFQIAEELRSLFGSVDSFLLKTIPLEGGNLMTAMNVRNELQHILGEAAVAHFCFFEKLFSDPATVDAREEMYTAQIPLAPSGRKKGFQKWLDSYFAITKSARQAEFLATQRVSKKYSMGHELNVASQGAFDPEFKKNIIAVPQYFYHIDLQMASLGRGRILIHSFEKSLEFLLQYKDKIIEELEALDLRRMSWHGSSEHLFEELVSINTLLAKEFETSIVHETARKLEKHGFSVHKCCGNLFYKLPENGSPSGLFGVFMNGIAGHSEKLQQDYFITAHSLLNCFEDYFKETLSEIGIQQCYFLNTTPDHGIPSGVNTMKFIEAYKGSIRCQTNTNLGVSRECQ